MTRSASPPRSPRCAPQRARPAGEVGSTGSQPSRLGPERRGLFGDALDARAEARHLALALQEGQAAGSAWYGRTGGRRGACGNGARPARRVAVGQPEPVAAGAAHRQRRIAAAVEEQQRLLARAERRVIACASGGEMHRPRSGGVLAQVDRRDLGGSATPKRSGRSTRRIDRVGVGQDLERGRGGGEDDRQPRSARAAPPCRGRGRARPPPACRRRRAPRRRRSGRGRRRAGTAPSGRRRRPARRRARPPSRRARACGGRPECHSRRAGAEAGLDPVEELARERDLGQQHQRLAARAQRLGDGFEIDLGLARPGDALQERGEKRRGGDGGAQRGGGLGLGGESGRGSAAGSRSGRGWARGVAASRRSTRFASGRRTRRETPARRASSSGAKPALPNSAKAASTRARAGVRRKARLPGGARQRAGGGRLAEAGRSRGQPQHDGQRGQGIVGGAGEELAHRRRQRRRRSTRATSFAELLGPDALSPPAPQTSPSTRRGPSGTSTRSPGRAPPAGAHSRAAGRGRRRSAPNRLPRSEEVRGIGRIEVFHRAIPWAQIPWASMPGTTRAEALQAREGTLMKFFVDTAEISEIRDSMRSAWWTA